MGIAGLAILNYFDRKKFFEGKGLEGKALAAELTDALDLIVKGIGALTGRDEINEIAKKIVGEDGLLKLSGELMVEIRPVDTNELNNIHQADIQVLRSL
jgi:hypothetical protein